MKVKAQLLIFSLASLAFATHSDENGADGHITYITASLPDFFPGVTLTFTFPTSGLADIPEAAPLDTTLFNQQEMLETAKEFAQGISDQVTEYVKYFLKYAPLAIFYAIGGEEHVCKIKAGSFEKILQLVVLTDHYGKFGGKEIQWSKFPGHVSPLFQRSLKEKVLFLRDWCCRIRVSGLDKIKTIETIRLGMKPRNQQDMLKLAKEYVEHIIQETSTSEEFFFKVFFPQASALAVSIALGDMEQIHNMSFSDFQIILILVVLADHYGKFGGHGISWEKFRDHAQPLFYSPKKMLDFLHDFCTRVCPEELESGYRATKKQEKQKDLYNERLKRLQSAKKFVQFWIGKPAACEILYLEASAMVMTYMISGKEQAGRMSKDDFQKLLHLVVLTDHYGKFGGKGLGWEMFILHVKPLLHGSHQEKWAFLLDLCTRVCIEALRRPATIQVASRNLLSRALISTAASSRITIYFIKSSIYRIFPI